MNNEADSSNSETLVMKFQSLLEEMKKEESPPMFIVAEGEGYSPNMHFCVPIDGEFSSGRPGEQEPKAASSQHQQTQQPATRNHSERSSEPTQSGTMVHLPPQTRNSSSDAIG